MSAPSSPACDPEERTGTVIRSTGSWYDVQTSGGVVPSKVRGKFRLREETTTNPVAVGDRVTLRLGADGTGMITRIHARRNKLSRRAAGRRAETEHVLVANVDRAWAVQSVRRPRFNPGFVDRFLVMAGVHEIPAGLVLNKIDLLREADRARIDFYHDLYAALGYRVLRTSAETGAGLDALREALTGQTNVIAGPSGTGKSSLLNAVEPGLDLRTGAVSDKTNKARHTTTHAALHPLSGGGFVADTPGLREFGLIDLEPDELCHFFVEFFSYLDDCRFPNCTHDHEPGCAVKAAVEAGKTKFSAKRSSSPKAGKGGQITEARYESYLNILAALRQGAANVGR